MRKFLLGGQKKKASKEEEWSESGGAEAQLSVTRAEADQSSRSQTGAGSLNPRQQLEAAYAKLFKDEGAGEAWRKEFFQKVRILVLGRSGVGKTTLIRLMVGKEGPQSVSEGVAGVQNINQEFLYSSEDQGVPLIIHDSNGMDVKGKERVHEIKSFLDKHQKGDDFSECIHIVWYVISAIDSRCVDDGDVLKIIISEYKIPLLLIMTHNDYEKVKVNDAVLNLLLQSAYTEHEEREGVKRMMVRVANDGVSKGANNALVIDGSKQDTEGLKLVAKRTQQLMDKKLRYTWIAAQAVDTDGKLNESAGIIAGYARRALFAALPRIIPLVDPLKLAIIFYRILVIMCQIWVVPPELKEALKETFMHKETSCSVLRRAGEDLLYSAGLLATVVTAGLALPAVRAVRGLPVTVLIKTFSLKVLGTILYVKSAQDGSSKQRWKPGVSKEEYVTLCEEFAHNADYQDLLLAFAKRQHSPLELAVRTKKVQGMMKSKIVELYRRLLRDRPNSLFSQMSRDDNIIETPQVQDTTRTAPARFHQQRPQVRPNIETLQLQDTTRPTPARVHQQRPQVPQNIEALQVQDTTRPAPTRFHQQRPQVPQNIETLQVQDTTRPAHARFPQQRPQVPPNIETINVTISSAPDKFHLQNNQVPYNIAILNNTYASAKFDQQCNQVPDNVKNLNDTTSLVSIEYDPQPDQLFNTIETLEDTTSHAMTTFDMEPNELFDSNSISQNIEPISSEAEYDYDEGEDVYDEGEDYMD